MNLNATIHALIHQSLLSLLDLKQQELPFKLVISEEAQKLSVHASFGFPLGTLKEALETEVMAQLQKLFPKVHIDLSLDVFIKAHKTQLPGSSLRGVKNIIAIGSGKGGVGKSTVASNLAIALAKAGARVGLLDADIYGPSIPLMMGAKGPIEIKEDRYSPALAHGVYTMSIGYLTEGEPALIWRGPMLSKALLQMLDITRFEELDYLFIDLPPGTGDIQLSLVQKIPLTGAVIVTTPQTVATFDAEKALKMFEKTNIDVLGLIENMSTHLCSNCGHEEATFGHGGAEALAKQFNLPCLAKLPLNSSIAADCEQGRPTAATRENPIAPLFMKAALKLAVEIGNKPLNYADKFPPIVVE